MRIALYGHGHMGRLHARHLAARAEVVVVDPAQGLAPPIDDVDAAVVAVPTPLHAEVALPLLRRGVPCLVEKPIAATLVEARALAAFPRCFVGHVERHNPAVALVRDSDARFVAAERVAPFQRRGVDVDVVLDLMIHDLDLFLALAGEPVTDVRANGIAVATGGIDICHARVETASGKVGTFTASRLARAASRRMRVFAPGAYWSLDLREKRAARVTWRDGALAEEVVAVAPRDALADQLDAFLAGRGVHASEGVAALELAMRVRDACR
ncbi:MAG: Gfo/Idh/MocA family protein [Myxococcota bacterium]